MQQRLAKGGFRTVLAYISLWVIVSCNPALSGVPASVAPDNDPAISGDAAMVRMNNPPFGGALTGYLVYWVVPVSWYQHGVGQVLAQGTFDSNNSYYASQGMIMHSTRSQYRLTFDNSQRDFFFRYGDATLLQDGQPIISLKRPNSPTNQHYYGFWSLTDSEIAIYNSNAAITPAPVLDTGDSYYLVWSLVIETNQGTEFLIHLNTAHIESFRYQVQLLS